MLYPTACCRPVLTLIVFYFLTFSPPEIHCQNEPKLLAGIEIPDVRRNTGIKENASNLSISSFDDAMENIYQAYLNGSADIKDLWKVAEYARNSELFADTDSSGLAAAALWQIQSSLEHGQCMVAFHQQTGNTDIPYRLYTFLITKNHTSLLIQNDSGIQNMIREYVAQLSVPPSHFLHKEEFLYNMLAIDSLGWQIRKSLFGDNNLETFGELIFIPHKLLYKLPFGALPMQKVKIASLQSWADYPFLLRHSNITYAFSGSWWMIGQRAATENRGILYKPEKGIGEKELYGKRTVEHIYTAITPAELKSLISEREFKWLYLAMHGDTSSQNVITNHQKLKFRGKSVILAMCTSVEMQLDRPSIMRTLPIYLAIAGADNICGSIWNVPDIQTSMIFRELFTAQSHEHFEMKRFLFSYFLQADGVLHHPYYWAAWIMFSKRRTS